MCVQACDLDGEVDLSSCYDVTEFPVQRNYGFQILVSSTHQHSAPTRLYTLPNPLSSDPYCLTPMDPHCQTPTV